MEFNNIGLSVQAYEPDQNTILLEQLVAPHLPGCPDPYQLLEQCAHCYGPHYHAYTSQPNASGVLPTFQLEEQYLQEPVYRSWADVPTSPPVTQTSSSYILEASDLSDMQPLYNDSHISHDPYSCEQMRVPQAGQKRTYAQIARDGYLYRPPPPAQRARALQHLDFLRVSQAESSSDDHLRSNGEFTRNRRPQYERNSSRADRPTGRDTRPALHQQKYNTSAPQLHGGMSLQQLPAAEPRNVDDFVQATVFRGHRAPPPSSLNHHGDLTSPISPGSLSIASSSASRPSNRRTGKELQDPSLAHRCPECRHTFPRLEDLNRHVSRTHTFIAQRPHRCTEPNCPWAFVNPKDLRRHQRVHRPEQPRFECPHVTCSKSYTRADNLTRHVNRDHIPDSAYLSFGMSRSASETSLSPGFFEQEYGS